MAEETKPPRSAVVVETAGGERIKPECPICKATWWGVPKPVSLDEDTAFQPVVSGLAGGDHLSLPVHMHVCKNCGFVWQAAKPQMKTELE